MKTEKIRAMIVEDNFEASQLLEKYLSAHRELQIISTVRNVDEATLAFIKQRPDLIFLDVELDGHTGFEFLENIREINAGVTVIFTTAFDHYAVEAIRHSAFDYLMKPIDPEELSATIRRYFTLDNKPSFEKNLKSLNDNLHKTKHLKLNRKHGFLVINPDEILYCKADWNYSEIFLTDQSKHTVTYNLGNLFEKLPEEDFIRANRSLILNLNYLQQVDKIKSICYLRTASAEITIPLSLARIHKLERLLEQRTGTFSS